jgi:hypothetical protein
MWSCSSVIVPLTRAMPLRWEHGHAQDQGKTSLGGEHRCSLRNIGLRTQQHQSIPGGSGSRSCRRCDYPDAMLFWRHPRVLGYYLIIVGFIPISELFKTPRGPMTNLGYATFFWVIAALILWKVKPKPKAPVWGAAVAPKPRRTLRWSGWLD